MAGTLKITDLVSFSFLDKNWSKVQDDFQGVLQSQQVQSGNQRGLTVQIAATHSGIITRNNGFYLPDRMKKGAATYIQDYPKPILLHHEDCKDPIGRVVEATYVDTSGSIRDRYRNLEVRNKAGKVVGKITDSLINDFVNNNLPFGQQVDIVRNILRDSSLLEDNGYEGLGYIRLTANITDPDAIQKLLDGRYLTGSVGATTDKAVCSVCRTDWTDNGPCDHKPGGIYDDAKCFIIAGNLVYDEYSFVNTPADRHSRVLQLDCNGRSQTIETINDYVGRIYEVQLGFPQYDSTTKEDKRMDPEDTNKTKGENTGGNVDIKDAVTPAPETVDQKTEGAGEVTDSTNTENSSTVEDSNSESGDTEESAEDLFNRVLDAKAEEVTLTDEEREKLYQLMYAEIKAAVKDGTLPIDETTLKDAELSTQKRKTLPKSSFCGPDRSFPVPDCAHVTAARRLINKYKGPGSKEAILACVDRKAKAMGCGSSKKTDQVQDSASVNDDMNHSRMLRMVLSVLDEDTYYTNESVLDDDEKKMLQSIIKRMAGLVGKDNFQSVVFAEGIAQDETALMNEVINLEEQVGELRDRLDASLKEHNILFQEYEELHDSLIKEKVATRKAKEAQLSLLSTLRDHKVSDETNMSNLSSEDLDSEIKRTLELVDMVKIADKLGDGMSRIPDGTTVENPTGIKDGSNQKRKLATAEELLKIQEHYMFLRFRSQDAAEAFLADMKRLGKLPQDGEQFEGGNN